MNLYDEIVKLTNGKDIIIRRTSLGNVFVREVEKSSYDPEHETITYICRNTVDSILLLNKMYLELNNETI